MIAAYDIAPRRRGGEEVTAQTASYALRALWPLRHRPSATTRVAAREGIRQDLAVIRVWRIRQTLGVA